FARLALPFQAGNYADVTAAPKVLAEIQNSIRPIHASHAKRRPSLFVDRDAFALRGADQLRSQQAAVFVRKLAFVILIVGPFIQGLLAGFLRGDGLARDAIVDFNAHLVGFRARAATDRETGNGHEHSAVVRTRP